MKKLTYIGDKSGVGVVLYKNYRSVIVTWNKPYIFTSADDTSIEAKEYYIRNFHSLGIRVIEDGEVEKDDLKEEGKSIHKKTNVDIHNLNVSSNNVNDGDIIKVLKEALENVDKDLINELEESDLGPMIDSEMDLEQIRELCKKLNYDYGNKRNKANIISALLENRKIELLNLIS